MGIIHPIQLWNLLNGFTTNTVINDYYDINDVPFFSFFIGEEGGSTHVKFGMKFALDTAMLYIITPITASLNAFTKGPFPNFISNTEGIYVN